jgi:hypothetical protein
VAMGVGDMVLVESTPGGYPAVRASWEREGGALGSVDREISCRGRSEVDVFLLSVGLSRHMGVWGKEYSMICSMFYFDFLIMGVG